MSPRFRVALRSRGFGFFSRRFGKREACSQKTVSKSLAQFILPHRGIGCMPLKTEPLEEPNFNLISLLDVVLTIVMFFMVSTTFSQNERQTEIKVPTVSDSSVLTGQPDEIVINVAVDGQMLVHSKPHSMETLTTLLQTALTTFPNQAVVIRGDGRCEYQLVMDAFSACKQAGIRNISVAHLPRPRGI